MSEAKESDKDRQANIAMIGIAIILFMVMFPIARQSVKNRSYTMFK